MCEDGILQLTILSMLCILGGGGGGGGGGKGGLHGTA